MDKTKQIMNEWYSAMAENNISVQPKASTILVQYWQDMKYLIKRIQKIYGQNF